MRTPCPQILDKRMQRWGMDYQDAMLLAGLFLASMVAIPLLPLPLWLATGLFVGLNGGAIGVVYCGKRNKPPGAMVHALHRWGLWPVGGQRGSLPGCIPERPQTYSCW